MLRTETKQIGESTYKVTQLDAVRARAVFLRLAQILAPALEKLGVSNGKQPDPEALRDKFLGGVSEILTRIKPEDLDYFCDTFAPSTCVVIHENGKTREPRLSTIIAGHFAGDDLVHLFEWLYFCVEVNFGSFFGKLGVQRGTSGVETSALK